MGYVIGLVILAVVALAAIMFTDPSADSQRLVMFFALIVAIATSIAGALKATQAATSSGIAATSLNGTLDQRIHDAVLRANETRRSTDGEG